MECTFFRSFCGNSKLNFREKTPSFSPPNSRLPAVIPAKAGIHFYRQIPAFTSFLQKNFGMTAFFRRIPPRSREWNVLFPVAEIPKLIAPNRFPLSQ